MNLVRKPAVGCLVIITAVLLCSGTSIFALDRICYGNLTQRLPIYPSATVETRSHNLFSEFGMGNTAMVLTTPDDPSTVRSWYAVHTGDYLREAVRNNSPFFRMAQGQVDITRISDDPDETGSQIILFGTCVN